METAKINMAVKIEHKAVKGGKKKKTSYVQILSDRHFIFHLKDLHAVTLWLTKGACLVHSSQK